VESITRPVGDQSESDGPETGDGEEGDSGSDSEIDEGLGRTRFWRDTARLAYSLGLSPKQFWEEYSYNELLTKLYFDRQRQEQKDRQIDAAAWQNSRAIANVLSGLFGEKPLPFHDLFPEPKKVAAEPAKIKSACAKHGLRPPTKF
jgi:hypothetical protein